MLNLTREQTIIEHRKMWNWMADQYEAGRYVEKSDYFKSYYNRGDVPHRECYCCDYVLSNRSEGCECLSMCPLEWPSSLECFDRESLYGKYCSGLILVRICISCCSDAKSDALNELSKIAREIANLPEKEVEHDSK